MHMELNRTLKKSMELYNLHNKFKNGYVYLEIQRVMYGRSPTVKVLSKQAIKKRIKNILLLWNNPNTRFAEILQPRHQVHTCS